MCGPHQKKLERDAGPPPEARILAAKPTVTLPTSLLTSLLRQPVAARPRGAFGNHNPRCNQLTDKLVGPHLAQSDGRCYVGRAQGPNRGSERGDYLCLRTRQPVSTAFGRPSAVESPVESAETSGSVSVVRSGRRPRRSLARRIRPAPNRRKSCPCRCPRAPGARSAARHGDRVRAHNRHASRRRAALRADSCLRSLKNVRQLGSVAHECRFQKEPP